MKRVLCTIPNCPDTIMGVRYTKTNAGMLSDPLPNEEADRLCTINGYEPYINVDDAKALALEAKEKAIDAQLEADEAAQIAADLEAAEKAKTAGDESVISQSASKVVDDLTAKQMATDAQRKTDEEGKGKDEKKGKGSK